MNPVTEDIKNKMLGACTAEYVTDERVKNRSRLRHG